MPEADPSSPSEPSAPRNLPVPVPRPSQVTADNADNWFTRALRAIFRWKSSSIRADLTDVLEDGAGETGFSPTERTMLKNILVRRERPIVDVMVPGANSIAEHGEIRRGELMRVFGRGAISGLVFYDEPRAVAAGMANIRYLVVFVTGRASLSETANRRRKKPFPAGLDLKAIDLSMPL